MRFRTYPPRFEQVDVLVDVDGTLIFNNEDSNDYRLNLTLVEAYKAVGIKQIYFFTDMTFRPHSIEERLKLIKELKDEHGIEVLGVITSPDLVWHVDDALLKAFWQDAINKNLNLRRIILDKTLSLDDELAKIFQDDAHAEIKSLIEGNFPENRDVLGKSFADVCSRLQKAEAAAAAGSDDTTVSTLGQNLSDKSNACKLILDIISMKSGIADPKGILLRRFIELRSKTQAYLVIDDKKSVLTSVTQVAATLPNEFAVFTLHVQQNQQQNFIDILAPMLYEGPFANATASSSTGLIVGTLGLDADEGRSTSKTTGKTPDQATDKSEPSSQQSPERSRSSSVGSKIRGLFSRRSRSGATSPAPSNTSSNLSSTSTEQAQSEAASQTSSPDRTFHRALSMSKTGKKKGARRLSAELAPLPYIDSEVEDTPRSEGNDMRTQSSAVTPTVIPAVTATSGQTTDPAAQASTLRSKSSLT